MHDFCKISPDGYTISIKVINSTFNEYGEQYFVTMDNNFVKYFEYESPQKGIHDGIWILKTGNIYIYIFLIEILEFIIALSFYLLDF